VSHQFLVRKAGGSISKLLGQLQCLLNLVGNWFSQIEPTTPAVVPKDRPAYLSFEVLRKTALRHQFVPQQSVSRMLSVRFMNNMTS
jgi:hypothetical protein